MHYINPDAVPYPSEDNPLLSELSKYLETTGLHDPYAKIYITTSPLPAFPCLMFLFVISLSPFLSSFFLHASESSFTEIIYHKPPSMHTVQHWVLYYRRDRRTSTTGYHWLLVSSFASHNNSTLPRIPSPPFLFSLIIYF